MCDKTINIELPNSMIRDILGDDIMTSMWRHLVEISCKWILNALSTGAHIHKGKVYKNYMIDLKVRYSKTSQWTFLIMGHLYLSDTSLQGYLSSWGTSLGDTYFPPGEESLQEYLSINLIGAHLLCRNVYSICVWIFSSMEVSPDQGLNCTRGAFLLHKYVWISLTEF